ncbi:hypothetical protein [Ascidiimonas aurantiaca]|uniref:hypothetical protein n=1 Tax=Ascidiimonas aurantiaca TaxID=1685432 RepID=UPI0030EC8AC2
MNTYLLYVAFITGIWMSHAQVNPPGKVSSNILYSQVKKIFERDQSVRSYILHNENDLDTCLKDSLWLYQNKLDFINSRELLSFIEKYGYPNSDIIGKPLLIFIVLMHTPQPLKQPMLALIRNEYQKGNIPFEEFRQIQWHLEGREGLPFTFRYDSPEQ